VGPETKDSVGKLLPKGNQKIEGFGGKKVYLSRVRQKVGAVPAEEKAPMPFVEGGGKITRRRAKLEKRSKEKGGTRQTQMEWNGVGGRDVAKGALKGKVKSTKTRRAKNPRTAQKKGKKVLEKNLKKHRPSNLLSTPTGTKGNMLRT